MKIQLISENDSRFREMYESFYLETEYVKKLTDEDIKLIQETTSNIGIKNDWGYFALNNKNVPIGFIRCSVHNSNCGVLRPGDVEIETYVKSECRGAGTGSELKEIAASFARKKGYSRLVSNVEDSNLANIKALVRSGFRKIVDSEYSDGHISYSTYFKSI
jgi:L-amino acid N-acyltransferase YncA